MSPARRAVACSRAWPWLGVRACGIKKMCGLKLDNQRGTNPNLRPGADRRTERFSHCVEFGTRYCDALTAYLRHSVSEQRRGVNKRRLSCELLIANEPTRWESRLPPIGLSNMDTF